MNPWDLLLKALATIGNAIAAKAEAAQRKRAAADLPRGAEINAQMDKDGEAIRARTKANGT